MNLPIKLKYLSGIILFIFGMLILMAPVYLRNYNFILLSGGAICYFSIHLLGENKIDEIFTRYDFSWLVFILISTLSYYWAVNSSLIWNSLFVWITLFLWMLIFRTFSFSGIERIVKKLGQGLLILTIIQVVFFFIIYSLEIFNVEKSIDSLFRSNLGSKSDSFVTWNLFFGENRNVTSVYYCMLFSILLFYQSSLKGFQFFKLFVGILLLYLLFISHSRGAIFCFIFLLSFYISQEYLKDYTTSLKRANLLIIVCLLILIGSFGMTLDVGNLPPRISMILTSLRIFLEQPLLGVGLNNWYIHAYKYSDLVSLNLLTYPTVSFARPYNHNFYSQLLVELGLLGFLAFFFPFGLIVLNKMKISLKPVQKSAIGIVIIYLIASFFYLNANSFDFYFSKIQFIAFCALGIVTSGDSTYKLTSKWIRIVPILLSIISFVWFLYTKNCFDEYNKAIQYLKTNPKVSAQKLASVYNANFNANFGVKNSISHLLAKIYQNNGDIENAQMYYKLALTHSPLDVEILYNYAYFLYLQNRTEEAKVYLEAASEIQGLHYDINLLWAKILIEENQFDKAIFYLTKVKRLYLPYKITIELLEESMILNTQYLDSIVSLTDEQKRKLSQSKKYISTRSQLTKDLLAKMNRTYDVIQGKYDIELIREIKRLATLRKEKEIWLMSLLNESQYKLLLGNSWLLNQNNENALKNITRKFSLTKNQFSNFESELIKKNVEINFLQIQQRASIIGATALRKRYKDLNKNFMKSIENILTKEQFREYRKDLLNN